MMTRLLKFLLLFQGLLVTAVAIAEIYKWVDEEGTVHYSDAPLGREDETVVVEPRYPDPAVRDVSPPVQDTTGSEGEGAAAMVPVPETTEGHGTVVDGEIDCFSPLGAAWGGRIADTWEAVSRRTLSDEEYRSMVSLLDGMVGRWWGSVEDVTCRSPNSEPPVRTDYYRVRLDARHRIDHIFKIGASLVGTKGTRAEFRQFFWLLLSRDGLRFREGGNDIVVELDQQRDDVGLLELENGLLTFFWRSDGMIRRVTVLSLQQTDTGFSIREYFYAQGQLSGKRQWVLER